jgi:hypothetical protein
VRNYVGQERQKLVRRSSCLDFYEIIVYRGIVLARDTKNVTTLLHPLGYRNQPWPIGLPIQVGELVMKMSVILNLINFLGYGK